MRLFSQSVNQPILFGQMSLDHPEHKLKFGTVRTEDMPPTIKGRDDHDNQIANQPVVDRFISGWLS